MSSSGKRPLFFFLAGFLLFLSFPSAAFSRDDWNYWNEVRLKNRLFHDDLRLRTGYELWLRDDFSEHAFDNFNTALLYAPNTHFEAGPMYSYEHTKGADGKKSDENRLTLEQSWKWGLSKLRFVDRNRVDYRNFQGAESWRYTNLFRIGFPVVFFGRDYIPFIEDELFYDTVPNQWNENRAAFGVSTRFFSRFSLAVYYRLKSDRNDSDWNETQVIQTTLTLLV